MKISESVLRNMIKKVVRAKLQEQSSLIDTQKQVLDQQRQRLDVSELSIESFQKLCAKIGVDEEALSPEAKGIVAEAMSQLSVAMEQVAATLTRVASVTNLAGDESV